MTFEPIDWDDDDQSVPHQQLCDSDDVFCPHTAYPLLVMLTLIEGDMTVRHTECGRAVLTDWPYLRAHDVPLELAYATDDQDEDWLELRLVQPAEATGGEVTCGRECSEMHTYVPGECEAAVTAEGPQEEATGGEQVQDGAVGRWGALLSHLDEIALRAERGRHGDFRTERQIVADFVRQSVEPEMLRDDLRAVLAERDALAARVAELEGERKADARVVAALAVAEDREPLDWVISNLIARFADRIEALDAIETEES